MPSGPAAIEMLRACRSFKTPLSVTWISVMSFSWLGERFVLGMGYVILLWHSLSLPYNYFGEIFVKYLQRAESFMGIC